MGDTEPTYSFNNDGSIDIPVDGESIRFVKETDLLTVKGGSETKAKQWENDKVQFNTQLAEANRLRDETHQSLLSEQAAREQLVEQHKDYDTHKTRVGELETELGSIKESIGKNETELASRIKASLLVAGASEEAIKDKTLDQLRNLETAASIFGNKQVNLARYDGGSGGASGGTVPENPLDRVHRILEEHEAKKGKVRVS